MNNPCQVQAQRQREANEYMDIYNNVLNEVKEAIQAKYTQVKRERSGWSDWISDTFRSGEDSGFEASIDVIQVLRESSVVADVSS